MTRIDDIEYTEKNGKKFYKIMAEGKTYRAWATDRLGKPIKAFEQLKAGEFKKDDNVDLKYTENSDGKYTYNNLTSIELLSGTSSSSSTNAPQPTPQTPASESEKPKLGLSYTDKQIVIVRQNALRHADERAKDVAILTKEIMEEPAYFKFAERIEEWIWRGIKK